MRGFFCEEREVRALPTMQNEIVNNYVADMAKYAEPSETVSRHRSEKGREDTVKEP